MFACGFLLAASQVSAHTQEPKASVLERIKMQQASGVYTAQDGTEIQKTIRITPEVLTDSSGLIYLGGKVSEAELAPYLARLRKELGDDYNHYRQNQGKRDHFSFHMTLINPYEYQNLDISPKELSQPLKVQLLGLGRVSASDKTTYYVVAQSADGQFFRQKNLLGPKDFHVTLGFNPQDVYGVSKGVETLLGNGELNQASRSLTR